MHSVDGLVFEEELIVLGNSNQEEDGGDIFKAVDPLLSLRTLSSDIKHSIGKISDNEGGLGDSSGLDSRTKNILVIWHIIRLGNALNIVKVAANLLAPKS